MSASCRMSSAKRCLLARRTPLMLPIYPSSFLRKTVAAHVKLGIYHQTMKDVSRRLCAYAITAAQGSWRQAARLLGIPRSTFHRIAKSAGLKDPHDSPQESFHAHWDKFKGGAAE